MRHAVASLLVLILAPAGSGSSHRAPEVALTDRGTLAFRHASGSPEKRYILETMGSGVALLDYDGDGDLDVYLVNASTLERMTAGEPGEPNGLFRNEGGWRFTDVTAEAGVGDRGFGQGVAVGDADNDGDPDLYVTNYGPNVFYRNNGDGTFSLVPGEASDPRWGTSAAFADADRDGFLDLYVCNYLDFDRELLDRLVPRQFCLWKGLAVNCGPRGFEHASGVFYRNRGDGAFEDATEMAGLANGETYQLGVVFSDLDLDGDVDLYVATDSTPNLLFENAGDGRFRDVSLSSGAALSGLGKEQAGMGVDAGDVNGDGRPDLFVTHFSDDYNTLYMNQGGLLFLDATDLAGLGTASLAYLGWSARLVDLNQDGALDIFLVNGHVYPQVDGAGVGESFRQPMQVFLNGGEGSFEPLTSPVLAVPRAARGAALGDLDGDGGLDAVVQILDGEPVLMSTTPAAGRGVVVLELVGRSANRDALGAALRAEAGERRLFREIRGGAGYLSHGEARAYLGLGGAPRLDSVKIQWPGGEEETLYDLAPGLYTVLEGRGIVREERR